MKNSPPSGGGSEKNSGAGILELESKQANRPAAVRPLFDYSRDSPLVSRDQYPSLASAGMPSNHPHPVYLEIWLMVLAFALLITLIGF